MKFQQKKLRDVAGFYLRLILGFTLLSALAAGESAKRIFALGAWEESSYFSEEEKAVLTLTKEITPISDHGVSDDVCGRVRNLSGEQYLAHLILAINTINSWNRIVISTRLGPE